MGSNAGRGHELLSMAWEGVGLYALAEGQVDRLLAAYTATVPERFHKILLKRLSAAERRKALEMILDDRDLTSHYPDLCALFAGVGVTRGRLAHGNLIYVEPDEEGGDDAKVERIREGLGIVGNAGSGHVSSDELELFRREAERLVGLLTALNFETADVDGKTPLDRDGYLTMPFGGQRVRLESPRQPMAYRPL
jgi:hypothetical protein